MSNPEKSPLIGFFNSGRGDLSVNAKRRRDPQALPSFVGILHDGPADLAVNAKDIVRGTAVPRIAGFGGYARSGKDTAAGMLVEQHGHRLLSFGTYVAALLREINPAVEIEADRYERAGDLLDRVGYEQAKAVPDFVRMLQDLGTGINTRDNGLWARLVMADLPADQRGVITGIRSLAQIDAVRQAGGLTIWVTRPGIEPRNAHRNELEVGPDDFDVVLANDGDLADLAATLNTVLRRHAALMR